MILVDFFIFKFQSWFRGTKSITLVVHVRTLSNFHALRWVNKLKDLTRQSLVQLVSSDRWT